MKRGTDCPGTPIIKRPTIHAKEALYTQKRPTYTPGAKGTCYRSQKRPARLAREQKSPTPDAKEPYSRRKRALLQTQKSPTPDAKEP